jgi:hypothetical protein
MLDVFRLVHVHSPLSLVVIVERRQIVLSPESMSCMSNDNSLTCSYYQIMCIKNE